MDFALEEHQEELRRLTREVLGGAQADGARKAAADAGLLGAAAPAEAGGAGLGAVEAAVVLREAAALGAPAEIASTIGLGVLPVAMAGTAEQRTALAPAVSGEHVLTAGFTGPAPVTAEPDGAGAHRLTGVRTEVPDADRAHTLLVPADLNGGGTGVFLVPRTAPGLTATGHGAALEGVHAPASALLGGDTTGAAARTLHHCALAAVAATAAGALAAALELTTEHVKTRRQFGRALAELQAVTMRVADMSIAARALDTALLAGAWRLATGAPDAGAVLETAALLVTEPIMDAFHAAQHLHGGLGVDASYPLHRHFAAGVRACRVLGGPEARLDALGAETAGDRPAHTLA